PPAGRNAGARDRAGAGRAHRRDRGAGSGACGALALSQGARSRFLRVRGGVRCGGARDRGRRHPPGTSGARWRRHKALARAGGRSDAGRPPAGAGEFRGGCGSGARRCQAAAAERLQDRAREAHGGARAERRCCGSLSMPAIGQPINRADGFLKVTGGARYAAEERIPGLTYGVLVQSTIGKGRIAAMDTAAAERSPGVLLVMTPFNAPRTASQEGSANQPGEGYPLLQDQLVHYNGQHIGLVVAESFEQATHAAGLVSVSYAAEPPVARLEQALDRAAVPKNFRGGSRPPDSSRGDADAAFAAAPVKLDVTYTTPVEHHNPMEPHAVIAQWERDGSLTLYHSTQAVAWSRERIAKLLGIDDSQIRIVSRYVGGGFGTK